MRLHHHPGDATLLAYGGGSLGEGLALVVATHLVYCPGCRRKLQDIEALGGAVLEELPPTPLAENALARLVSRLDDGDRTVMATPVEARSPSPGSLALPEPLRGYVGAIDEGRWRRVIPGIRQIEVLPRTPAGGNARLLRVTPGTALTRHGHEGRELTVVLAGSFSDEVGRFGPGDLAEADEDVRHQPVADLGTDCVCLIATDAPLRFTSLLARVLQPFFRI